LLFDIPLEAQTKPIDPMPRQRYALLSLNTKAGSEHFAASLADNGFSILSSGGTAKYLQEKGIQVTDVSEITGQGPVLDHRVATLWGQIHGGLLATPEMYPELESLGWSKIDLLYVDFYPLQDEMGKPDATFESCLKRTDIGGPAMIRSACKGGEVIVMTSASQTERVLAWINAGEPDREQVLYALRSRAEQTVAEYCARSAEVYKAFKHKLFPGGFSSDFAKSM
jgi:phosphoribosylaminoimidazolecarboxamide formyltransferase / IMP cyclohydrolase